MTCKRCRDGLVDHGVIRPGNRLLTACNCAKGRRLLNPDTASGEGVEKVLPVVGATKKEQAHDQ